MMIKEGFEVDMQLKQQNQEDEEDKAILLIDEDFKPPVSEAEAEELKPIQKEFIEDYIAHHSDMSVETWLLYKFKQSLPEKSDEEIESISSDIINTLKVNEEKKISLQEAIREGRSKESWLASELKRATSAMSQTDTIAYMHSLDEALVTANTQFANTITTISGKINMNPYLDGFIAEQYHAQTFNLNAEASGSPYRAKVLQPSSKGYAKNSVDLEIVDGVKKVVKRYQSKYCSSAEYTEIAYNQGDYRGQRLLAPADQIDSISRKASSVIEAPDGTTSNPLTKADAKELQEKAQSGKWEKFDWDNYSGKDVTFRISQEASQAAVMGVAVGIGFEIVNKVWDGESIDGAEVVEAGLKTGTDFGVKAAAAGALKLGAEKGIIKVIPKGTSADMCANIAFVGIENAKVLGKMASGELTLQEGVEKLEETTVTTVAGLAASKQGAVIGRKIGERIGLIFGFKGAAIGAIVGGAVGYMAGSKVGNAIVKGVRKIREKVVEAARTIKEKVSNVTDRVVGFLRRPFDWIFG